MKRHWIAIVLALTCCSIVGVAAATAATEESVTQAPSKEAPSEEAVTPMSGPTELAPLGGKSCPYNSSNPAVFCAYGEFHFMGNVGETLCKNQGRHVLAQIKSSAKNECSNRAVWIQSGGGAASACMNPGGERPVREFNEVVVGAPGTRCG